MLRRVYEGNMQTCRGDTLRNERIREESGRGTGKGELAAATLGQGGRSEREAFQSIVV